jgi:hypothetical protein
LLLEEEVIELIKYYCNPLAKPIVEWEHFEHFKIGSVVMGSSQVSNKGFK